MPNKISNFAILVVELGKANSPSVQELLINKIFNYQTLTDWSEALNYINNNTSPNPNLIIMNSNIMGKSSVGITMEQIITAILHRKTWNCIPTMLVRKRVDLNMDQFRKDENITKNLLTPFEHEDFLNAVYTLLKLSIDKHITEVNNQHIELSKRFQVLVALVKKQSPDAKIKASLQKVKEETQQHFQFEENHMQPHNYPGFETHHQKHQCLIKLLEQAVEIIKSLTQSQLIEFVQKLRTDIAGDLNDDKEYILFLNKVYKEIDEEIKNNLSLVMNEKD